MSDGLILVKAGRGLCLWMTLAEWAEHIRGVDLEAARQHDAPIELDEEDER